MAARNLVKLAPGLLQAARASSAIAGAFAEVAQVGAAAVSEMIATLKQRGFASLLAVNTTCWWFNIDGIASRKPWGVVLLLDIRADVGYCTTPKELMAHSNGHFTCGE